MDDVIRFFFFGITAGSAYALLGLGIVLIYRGSGVLNFAQGAVGFVGLAAFHEARPSMGTAGGLVFGVALTALLGAVIQVLVMRPLRNSSPLVRVIATLSILTAIQQAGIIRYGVHPTLILPFLPTGQVEVGSVTVGKDRIVVFVVTVLLTVLLWAVYRYTRFGIATTAAAEKEEVAASLGWSPHLLAVANWAAGCALAGLAGIIYGPITGLAAPDLAVTIVPALAAALVGRFNGFGLTLFGGLMIGVLEAETTHFVRTPGWQSAVPFIVILLMLVLRGRGLPLRAHLSDRLPKVDEGRMNWWLFALLAAFGVGSILLLSDDWSNVMITGAMFGLVVLSQVVVTGYGGQLSLAQFSLAGIGALVSTRLADVLGVPFPLALIAGVVVTVAAGALVALPAVRIRGVSLAVATLGMSLVIETLVLANPDYTGGAIRGTVIPDTSLFGLNILSTDHPKRYAMVTIAVLALATLAVINVRRGASGRRLISMRDNERAAASLGISVVGAKLHAFCLAAAVAAVGGVVYGFRFTHVDFSVFDLLSSIVTVLYGVVGGIGYAAGGIGGGAAASGGPFSYVLGQFFDTGNWYLLGASLVLIPVLMLQPDGIAQKLAVDFKRLTKRLDFLHTDPPRWDVSRIDAADPCRPTALEIKDLTVTFGGVTALSSVSLRVEPGQIVGLIGPNGAGKTTLIDAVTGYHRHYRGSITLNDQPVDDRGVAARARAGLVRSFQSLELFEELTVADNLRAASESHRRMAFLTDIIAPGPPRLSASALLAVREFQLEDVLNRRPADLPYATRRLVAIARAVATQPAVLLLDEPAAGLDERSSRELADLIRRLAKDWGMAVLLVEHDVAMVLDLCDHVEVLNFGKTLASGPPLKIRTDPAVVEAYIGTTADDAAELVTAGPVVGSAGLGSVATGGAERSVEL